MAEIKLQKRVVYAGDIHRALLEYGWSLSNIANFINGLPKADVAEVRHGHWVDRPTVKGQVYCCECATIEKATDSNYKSQYCPNCGTKMDWI